MSEQARHRIFPKEPTNLFIDSVCECIAKTGEPETLADLFHNKISKTEPFTILRKVTINWRKRRNSNRASCPMCGHANQFLKGYLCWFHECQFVAVIGHCCASKKTLEEARKNYENKNQKKAEEDYLLATLHHVPAMLSAIHKIRPAAIEAQRLHHKFRKEAALIQRSLRQATKTSDSLVVSVEISEQLKAVGQSGFRGRQGHIETTDFTFGRLSGRTAIHATYNPADALDNMEKHLSNYNVAKEDDQIVDFICKLNEKDRKFCVGKIKEVGKSFQDLQKKLIDFSSFFDADNLQRLDKWGHHPENPTPIIVEDLEFIGQRRITIKCKLKSSKTVLSPKAILWDFDVSWPIK